MFFKAMFKIVIFFRNSFELVLIIFVVVDDDVVVDDVVVVLKMASIGPYLE